MFIWDLIKDEKVLKQLFSKNFLILYFSMLLIALIGSYFNTRDTFPFEDLTVKEVEKIEVTYKDISNETFVLTTDETEQLVTMLQNLEIKSKVTEGYPDHINTVEFTITKQLFEEIKIVLKCWQIAIDNKNYLPEIESNQVVYE